jgi:hypothetical protein
MEKIRGYCSYPASCLWKDLIQKKQPSVLNPRAPQDKNLRSTYHGYCLGKETLGEGRVKTEGGRGVNMTEILNMQVGK